ncbi:hypothetical protein CHISP_0545 [Chitinispirillum alkaliphilum]|nr:hypothetical protein CHISP_0545 [Chitinispirillum alkaliphilum]
MKRIHLKLLIILSVAVITHAQTYLTGEVKGTLQRGEYIVTGTLYILSGQSLTIEPGTVIYFEQFSGIKVLGTLICEGTPDNPIVLTSIRERPSQIRATPEAFDWNGIEVTNDAIYTSVSQTKIRHSIFGMNIRSPNTSVRIDRVEFLNNGYGSVVREGKIIEVQQNFPFSISWNINGDHLVIKRGDSDTSDSISAPKHPEQRDFSTGKMITRSLTAAVFAGTAALFTYNQIQYSRNRTMYDSKENPQAAQHYREKYTSNNRWRIIAGSAAMSAVAGFSITFLF